MKFKSILICLFLSVITNFYSFSQIKKKIIIHTDFGFLMGLKNDVLNEGINAARIKIGASYLTSKNLSIGFNIGTDSYRNGGTSFNKYYNTLPLNFVATRFFKPTLEGLFTDINLGYAIKVSNNFESGFNFGLGGGYNIPLTKKTLIGFKTGYNFQEITDGKFSNNNFSSLDLSSIRLSIGLIF